MNTKLQITVKPLLFLNIPVFYLVINGVESKRIVLNLVESGEQHLIRHCEWVASIPKYVDFAELPNDMGIEFFSDDNGDVETLKLVVCGKDHFRNTYTSINQNMYYYFVNALEDAQCVKT